MSSFVFDLDGTIVDSAPGILAGLKHTVALMGVEQPSDEILRAMIGPALRPSFAKLLGSDEHVETGIRIYRDYYGREGIGASDPYHGIGEELRRLHAAGHTLFVCTSKMETFAKAIIERIGFTALFTAIYGAQMGGAGDDKRELLARLLVEQRVDPARATMIGDRREDIAAGRTNGLRTVGVLWGYGDRAELTEAGASVICESVAKLGDALTRSPANER